MKFTSTHTLLIILLSLFSGYSKILAQNQFRGNGIQISLPVGIKSVKPQVGTFAVFTGENDLTLAISDGVQRTIDLQDAVEPLLMQLKYELSFANQFSILKRINKIDNSLNLKDTTISGTNLKWGEFQGENNGKNFFTVYAGIMSGDYHYEFYFFGQQKDRTDNLKLFSEILNSYKVVGLEKEEFKTKYKKFQEEFAQGYCDCLTSSRVFDFNDILFKYTDRCIVQLSQKYHHKMVYLIRKDKSFRPENMKKFSEDWIKDLMSGLIGDFIKNCDIYRLALTNYKNQLTEVLSSSDIDKEKRIDEILKLESSIEGTKKLAEYYLMLALMYEFTGDIQKALTYFDKSLEQRHTTSSVALKALMKY